MMASSQNAALVWYRVPRLGRGSQNHVEISTNINLDDGEQSERGIGLVSRAPGRTRLHSQRKVSTKS
jgi:hypothetical protein